MNGIQIISKPLTWFMAALLAVVVAGCGGGSDSPAALNSDKAITSFTIGGAVGAINQTAKTIAITVPNGTVVTALVPTFTITGGAVTIGTPAVTQVSATTANDFTTPKVYVVTAADGSTASYTVTVSVAAASAKVISSFSLAWTTGTPGTATGTISGTSSPYAIALTVPNGTNVTALVATFATTGASVSVGTPAVTQVSGAGGTANNFTGMVPYTVHAADGSTAIYNVTVTVAAASAKAISSFSLAWTSGTPGTATGSISGASSPYAIALTVPNGTNLTALVATFATTGTSVTVGATTQVSGTGGTANDFTNMVAYTVHAADASTAIYNVTVTASALPNPTAPTLGEAGRFVILAPAAITTTGVTAISDGDIGISPAARSLMTGFVANGSTGAVNELTNGTTYAADDSNPAPYPYPLHFSTPVVGAPWTTTAAMLTQANTDLGIADVFLAADPNPGVNVITQICPTELGTLTLTRGVYKTASNVGISTGALTLDAQGDPNSVFIFNIGGTLSTGAPGGNIVLINGALAKNIYWRTAGITTIGAGTIFKGLVFANTQVNVLSGANITGSLFAVTDRVTLIADTVTKAP